MGPGQRKLQLLLVAVLLGSGCLGEDERAALTFFHATKTDLAERVREYLSAGVTGDSGAVARLGTPSADSALARGVRTEQEEYRAAAASLEPTLLDLGACAARLWFRYVFDGAARDGLAEARYTDAGWRLERVSLSLEVNR